MNQLLKSINISKKFILPFFWTGVGLTLAYFLTRLINLTIIPIFTDEAIYLRWGQIALSDPRWRFISLIDGKQPLLIWLFLPVFKFFRGDPLILGRMVSVLAGYGAMAGMAIFGGLLTRNWKGFLIGGLLYIITPFFLVYDRLAIYDGLFGGLTMWTLILLFYYGSSLRLDLALILGTLIGFGLLTKSYAYFFLILLPLTLLLVKWPKSDKKNLFIKWIATSFAIFIQSQIYVRILHLSEYRHNIADKNLQFIYSWPEIMSDPFRGFIGKINGLSIWLIDYLTIPFFLILIIGNYWYFRKEPKNSFFFLGLFIIPFITLAFFGKVLYPRFILFMIFPLFMPLIVALTNLYNNFFRSFKLLKLVGLIIILLPLLYFDFKLLTDPIRAPLPIADKKQFLNDWPAGFGIKEVVAFLAEEAANNKIVVGTEGTFGLFPMALELYLGTNNNVSFKPYWPVNQVPEELLNYAKETPTYLIFKERQDIPNEWPLKLIAQYRRGNGSTYLKFYRVIP